MGKNIALRLGSIIGVGLLLAACGSSTKHPTKSTDTTDSGGAGGSTDTACEPGSQRCDGPTIMLCNDEGTGETATQTCSGGLYCVANAGAAKCDTRACVPGQALCRGSSVATCKSDGSGPTTDGVDCSKLGQSCVNGGCVPVTCEPGSIYCANSDVYACSADGMSSKLVADCTADQVCDSEGGVCKLRVCTPNAAVCTGSVAKTCNEFGSDWASSEDCDDSGLKCLGGKCSKHICEPAQSYCQDGNVVQCDLQGEAFTPRQTCDRANKQHCESTGSFAYCTLDVCEAGEKVCEKNTATTCTDDGQFADGGMDCGSSAWCLDGECQPRTCPVNQYYCEGDDIYYCLETEPPQLVSSCGAGLSCHPFVGGSDAGTGSYGVLCLPPTCSTGDKTCLLNKIGTCGADGETLSSVTTDCTTDDKVCTADGKCAASAVDALGVDESTQPAYSDNFMGDVVMVASARTLTQIGMYLDFHSVRQLRWVIYEQTASSLVAKVDKVVSVASSSGLLTSPAFTFQLQPGKSYVVGVVVSGGGATYSLDTAPFETKLSFGTLIGYAVTSYTSTIDYSNVFLTDGVIQMQLTTELP
ncbi:MAG TPA: hypothetical protein VEQ58_23675 [Polyangiaceae bacterium]|nr:hypothetical protein [Polyangiaceae bacterium]